jgi:cysteinyl-tRNA synthetase
MSHSGTQMLSLYNTLSRSQTVFTPIDATNVGMYVCGPTVYAPPHIGNARSVVVYDMLYRHLVHHYGQKHVTYIRNITDVDDKIVQAAQERKMPIGELTEEITAWFRSDMESLFCLPPTYEPRATEHIQDMIRMITELLATEHAYIADGHVYFSVASDPTYGKLAGRDLKDMMAGARIEVVKEKRHPGDFVLWKPAEEEFDPSAVFDSPWGKGRPGWHIECSAMSTRYLGPTFDIHGGGADLMFPHHTNEIAQSHCCDPEGEFAKIWVHNGFVTVDGEKMSKSIGNVTLVRDLLAQGIDGETIRLVFLSTHYRKPLDWTDKVVRDAKKTLDFFYTALDRMPILDMVPVTDEILIALNDDLNTPLAISHMHQLAKAVASTTKPMEQLRLASQLYSAGKLMGFFNANPEGWFADKNPTILDQEIRTEIELLITERNNARRDRNFSRADALRDQLANEGIILKDHPDGTTTWSRA